MAEGRDGIRALIGGTPMVRLRALDAGLPGEIWAKLEMFNPTGSVTDRAALAILDGAEAAGRLVAGGRLLEATSGSMGLSLTMLGVPRGYSVGLVMPAQVPEARVRLLRAMGAEVHITPASRGMRGAQERLDALAIEQAPLFLANQFANTDARLGFHALADEIMAASGPPLGALIAGLSTGALLSGAGERLKRQSAAAPWIVAVEPAASPVLSGGEPGVHKLFGMGPPFVPALYDPAVVDEIVAVSDIEATRTLLRLFRSEGIPSGPTGGAALAAALQIAARATFRGRRIVVILPDSMERYAQTGFWETAPGVIADIPVVET